MSTDIRTKPQEEKSSTEPPAAEMARISLDTSTRHDTSGAAPEKGIIKSMIIGNCVFVAFLTSSTVEKWLVESWTDPLTYNRGTTSIPVMVIQHKRACASALL
jgi:hypothetical protein